MSTRIKQKRTVKSLAILCFPLSCMLLFDESESFFIRFSTAVSLESVSFIFEVKTFYWSIKCCNIARCCCRSNIISVCEWDASTQIITCHILWNSWFLPCPGWCYILFVKEVLWRYAFLRRRSFNRRFLFISLQPQRVHNDETIQDFTLSHSQISFPFLPF